jgi:hypothetical protein
LKPVKFTRSRKQYDRARGRVFNQEKSNDGKPRF